MVDQILEYIDQFCVSHLEVYSEEYKRYIKETKSMTSKKQFMGLKLKS